METAIRFNDTTSTGDFRLRNPLAATGAIWSSAWEKAYKDYGDRVYAYLLRATGDAELAADLTHDAFVRIAERSQQRRGADVAPWLFSIARNLFLEQKRRTERASRNLRLMDHSGHRPRPPIETNLSVRAAVDSLPEDQRLVLLLYHVDGYTHSEISEILEIAEGTSKARLSRARATLRQKLESQK